MSKGWISALAGVALCLGVTLVGCSATDAGAAGSKDVVPKDWNLTADDWDAAYDELVANLHERPGVDDDVEFDFVRWVPVSEWPDVQVACIAEAGFGARVNNGGMLFDEVPEAQGSALDTAVAKCQARYPMDARAHMTLPTERASAEYKYYKGDLTDCVEKLGYVVSEPPSEQTWLDTYYAGKSPWSPYDEAISQAGTDEDAQNQLWTKCSPYSDNVYPPL